MNISFEDCAPYLSTALLLNSGNQVIASLPLGKAIRKLFSKKDANGAPLFDNRKVHSVTDGPVGHDTSFSILHYSEKKTPGWYLGNIPSVVNTIHNIIVIGIQGSLVSLTFTDSAMRNRIISNVIKSDTGLFKNLDKLSVSQMEKIFVESKVRTLWLTGAHRRSLIKPDAKVISGLELESALDPLGDQSYFFSSVRSTFADGGFTIDGKPTVLGASPKQSRVWIGPNNSWTEFETRLDLILQLAIIKLADGNAAVPAIPVLAQSTNDLNGLGKPYGISLIVPEQLMPDGDDEIDDKWFQLFSDTAVLEVEPSTDSKVFNLKVSWGETAFGDIKYELSMGAKAEVKVVCSKVNWIEDDDQSKEIFNILKNPEFLTIYFDSGHTLSRGRMIKTQFRDARFKQWDWINIDTDITDVKKEKPLDGRRFDIESIGNLDDDSLFGLMARHYPNLENSGDAQGWLVCDDGAMESADFIYLDDTHGQEKLELIHVKGSHSNANNRGLSVSDYEIVVGQAVKNLRHIDRNSLVEKLRANKDNKIGTAVWKDGVRQANRDGFLIALGNVSSDIEKTVIVFQPRVRKSVRDLIINNMGQAGASQRRLQQLDTLLLSARSSCFDLGAKFVVIADGG